MGALRISALFLAIGAIALTSGCVQLHHADPHSTAGFVAKPILAAPKATVWKATLAVLGIHSIPVRSAMRQAGIIDTGYVSGSSYTLGYGLIGSQETRYRYEILIRPVSRLTSTVHVTANLQASDGAQWVDVTTDNSKEDANLAAWMEEQIQNRVYHTSP